MHHSGASCAPSFDSACRLHDALPLPPLPPCCAAARAAMERVITCEEGEHGRVLLVVDLAATLSHCCC